jgi:acyl carrier protein
MSEPRTVDVIKLFEQAALELADRKLEGLTRDTVINRLGMDSVTVMELISYFEDHLQLQMPDEDLARVSTLGDLARLVARLLPPGSNVAA